MIAKKSKPTLETANSKVIYYPKGKDITINNANLKLELKDFEQALKTNVNIPIILTLMSLWGVFFTKPSFPTLFNGAIKGTHIFVTFFVITIIMSVIILKSVAISLFRMILKIFFSKTEKIWIKKWRHKNEIDPDEKAESIIKMCQ